MVTARNRDFCSIPNSDRRIGEFQPGAFDPKPLNWSISDAGRRRVAKAFLIMPVIVALDEGSGEQQLRRRH
ncbi:MAG: hypothetical protein O2967_19450 [Proteobacteria bacterium]|nr:hypothetical protein [Pseudomonadota bacterium]